jgi:hypothetical protein
MHKDPLGSVFVVSSIQNLNSPRWLSLAMADVFHEVMPTHTQLFYFVSLVTPSSPTEFLQQPQLGLPASHLDLSNPISILKAHLFS